MNLKKTIQPDPSCRYKFLGIFLLALVLIFLKMPMRITHGFLWAEDINVFMKGAYEQGLSSLIIPCASYLQMVPRSIAYLQSIAGTPISAPYFYVIACTLITALCSAYIFGVASHYLRGFGSISSHLRDDLLALLVSVSFFLIPVREVFLNITNLQWILAPTMLVLLFDLFVLQEKSYLWIKIGALFLIALTGPFSILFLPIVVFMIIGEWKKTKKLSCVSLMLVFLLGVLIQGITLLIQQKQVKDVVSINWWNRIVEDLFAQLFFVIPPYHSLLGKICISAVPIMILLSMISCSRRSLVPFALMLAALEIWYVSVAVRLVGPEAIQTGPCGGGARYYFIPALFLAWALILSVKLVSPIIKIFPVIALSLLFISGITQFREQNYSLWKITEKENTYHVIAPPGWEIDIAKKQNQ